LEEESPWHMRFNDPYKGVSFRDLNQTYFRNKKQILKGPNAKKTKILTKSLLLAGLDLALGLMLLVEGSHWLIDTLIVFFN
jgi:hypothetical protein